MNIKYDYCYRKLPFHVFVLFRKSLRRHHHSGNKTCPCHVAPDSHYGLPHNAMMENLKLTLQQTLIMCLYIRTKIILLLMPFDRDHLRLYAGSIDYRDRKFRFSISRLVLYFRFEITLLNLEN